jgi:hypothetical protein
VIRFATQALLRLAPVVAIAFSCDTSPAADSHPERRSFYARSAQLNPQA